MTRDRIALDVRLGVLFVAVPLGLYLAILAAITAAHLLPDWLAPWAAYALERPLFRRLKTIKP